MPIWQRVLNQYVGSGEAPTCYCRHVCLAILLCALNLHVVAEQADGKAIIPGAEITNVPNPYSAPKVAALMTESEVLQLADEICTPTTPGKSETDTALKAAQRDVNCLTLVLASNTPLGQAKLANVLQATNDPYLRELTGSGVWTDSNLGHFMLQKYPPSPASAKSSAAGSSPTSSTVAAVLRSCGYPGAKVAWSKPKAIYDPALKQYYYFNGADSDAKNGLLTIRYDSILPTIRGGWFVIYDWYNDDARLSTCVARFTPQLRFSGAWTLALE
jgi:hypothetical protein